jgi:hypothetical protein
MVWNRTFLFSEITTSDLCLHAVAVNNEEVYGITLEALKSFDTNLKGPYSYLRMYEAYLHILNGEAESAMLTFMKTDPFPTLQVLFSSVKPSTQQPIVSDCIAVS